MQGGLTAIVSLDLFLDPTGDLKSIAYVSLQGFMSLVSALMTRAGQFQGIVVLRFMVVDLVPDFGVGSRSLGLKTWLPRIVTELRKA